MPVANAGIGLPGIRPDLVEHTAFAVEHTQAGVRVFFLLAGIDRFYAAAIFLRADIVVFGD